MTGSCGDTSGVCPSVLSACLPLLPTPRCSSEDSPRWWGRGGGHLLVQVPLHDASPNISLSGSRPLLADAVYACLPPSGGSIFSFSHTCGGVSQPRKHRGPAESYKSGDRVLLPRRQLFLHIWRIVWTQLNSWNP